MRFEIGGYWLSQRRGSPMWCATWFDTATRQTRRESLGTDDFKGAKVELAKYVTLKAIPNQGPDEALFDGILARYFDQHAQHTASADFARYAIGVISEAFPEKAVAELTRDVQKHALSTMRARGWSDGYIRRILGVGVAALRWAQAGGELISSPQITLPKDSEPRDRVLSLEEMQALWLATEHHHERMFMALACNTLGRPEALLDVTREMADLDRRLIALNPPGRPQTKKRRPVVPVSGFLLPWLKQAPSGFLVRWRGESIESFKTAFRAMRHRARLGKDVVAKTIRHTMATELRSAGVPEAEIQGFLGHKAYGGVTEVYAKYRPDYLGQAVKAIDAYMRKVKKLTRN
jgi:integrase